MIYLFFLDFIHHFHPSSLYFFFNFFFFLFHNVTLLKCNVRIILDFRKYWLKQVVRVSLLSLKIYQIFYFILESIVGTFILYVKKHYWLLVLFQKVLESEFLFDQKIFLKLFFLQRLLFFFFFVTRNLKIIYYINLYIQILSRLSFIIPQSHNNYFQKEPKNYVFIKIYIDKEMIY